MFAAIPLLLLSIPANMPPGETGPVPATAAERPICTRKVPHTSTRIVRGEVCTTKAQRDRRKNDLYRSVDGGWGTAANNYESIRAFRR